MDLSNAFSQIDTVVRRQMQRDRIPGLSLALTDRDGMIYRQTYGQASLESGDPVHPDHMFEFGSIGKSFTAIVLLQLAEEGVLSVDHPVVEYLPWFEVQSEFELITLHHLMTHSAGIIRGTDFSADPRFEVWALRETRAVHPPGAHFHYSNVGYKALGLVLERVTGKPYADLVRERILEPLGMKGSVAAITHDTRKRLVTGYQRFYDDRPWRRNHGNVPATWLESNTADGCIAGTASDLATYLRMLMSRGDAPGGRILSYESFSLLTSPHISLGDLGTGDYSYGLHVFEKDGREYLEHGGGMVGYYAYMIADLSTGYGAVTMINGPGNQQPIVTFAIDALDAASKDLPVPDHPLVDPYAVDDPDRFTGRYESDSGRIEFASGDGVLSLRWDGEIAAIEPRGSDAFLVEHEDFERYLLRFERNGDGRVVSVTHGDRCWYPPGTQPEPANEPEEWKALTGHYRSHNPWGTNFRVILRGGELHLVSARGHEQALIPRPDGSFIIGDECSPEFIRFDTIVDGQAWRANVSGSDYYRFFTP